jgi:peptidyl-prolyl cis-trans isomerase D
MLDFMRRQRSTLKWVWVVIIFIFSVTLVTLYIPFDQLGTVAITTDVADIGGETITAREFQNAYRNYLNNVRGQLNPEMLRAFRFEQQILDSLVMRSVTIAEAKRLGLDVSDAEIEQKILSNPVFLENGAFIGQARYQSILLQNNITVDEFESSVRDELLAEKLRSFVTAGVVVSDQEVEREYRRANEKARVDYFVIDPAKLESQVSLTEQDQRDYYEKNKAKYNIPEKRKARYVFIESLKLRAQVTETDDELRQYYEQHRTEYELPERVTAQHILFRTQGKTPQEVDAIREKARGVLERAKRGEDFAALAKEFSEDGSAADGGNLGSFTRGQMVPEFEQAVFSLGTGAISDLVQTQFGIHIIKANEKVEGRMRPFDELKEAIRPIVETRKAEEMAANIAQQVASELVTNRDLAAVAQKHGAELKETPLMQQGQPIPDVGAAAEFDRRIFTLAKDEIGTAVQVERGYVVPVVTDIQPAHAASFEEAQAMVITDVRSEKAAQLATQKSNQAQELLKNGRDLAAAARAAGSEVLTTDLLTRGSTVPEYGSLASIENEMFSLPIGQPGTPSTVGGKTLAFVVKERQDINAEEMKKSMETVRGQLLQPKRDQYFAAYIQEARTNMEARGDIVINEAVVSQIASTTS